LPNWPKEPPTPPQLMVELNLTSLPPMANLTAPTSTIGSWEELYSVTFDIGALQIRLLSEDGRVAEIPCDDFAELHRLAQVSFALADGYDVELNWKTPVLGA